MSVQASFRCRRLVNHVAGARHWVRDQLTAAEVPAAVTRDMAIVTAELVTNALEHGCGEWIDVDLSVHGSSVGLAVTSDGKVDLGLPRHWTMPPPGAVSGRGLALIAALVSDVRWTARNGRLSVRVRRAFEPA